MIKTTKAQMTDIYFDRFDRFVITLHEQCVIDCTAQGPSAVANWAEQESDQLSNLSLNDIRNELAELGCWDATELYDDDENKRRILWIAACRAYEDREEL